MLQQDLLNDIETVLDYFQNSTVDMDRTIYERYRILKNKLQLGDLKHNIISGSARAYLDAHSDWDNPILLTMGDLETKVELMVNE